MTAETDTALPATSSSGNDEARCPECGHRREGTAPSRLLNALRKRIGREPLGPSCNTGTYTGIDDHQPCGCRHECHAELVTRDLYTLEIWD
jgi:hypothetical protein